MLVYGVAGSGKTTAAARISAATGLAWTSVDELTWKPGWVAVPEAEQRRRIELVCARDEWLLDTAYGDWLDVPLSTVDLIVALDYPRWFSLQRLARRSLARVVDKRPICNGNIETWRGLFSRESIIAWHFRSFASKHQRIVAWDAAAAEPGPRVLRFTSSAQLDEWVEALQPVAST